MNKKYASTSVGPAARPDRFSLTPVSQNEPQRGGTRGRDRVGPAACRTRVVARRRRRVPRIAGSVVAIEEA